VVEERFVRQWHPHQWELRNTTWHWVIELRLLPGDVEFAYADDLLRYTDLMQLGRPILIRSDVEIDLPKRY
jgi:hypothetical protein